MKWLANQLRKAEAEPELPEEKIDKSMEEAIDSMEKDEDEVKAFLSALAEYDEARASAYVRQIRSKHPALFAALKKAETDIVAPLPKSDDAPSTPDTIDTAIEPNADLKEVAVPIVNPSELEKEASLSLVLINKGTPQSKWLVLADSVPLAEINLSDQPQPQEIQPTFESPEYEQHVLDAVAGSVGLQETLKAVKARYYHAVTSVAKVNDDARAAASKQLENQYATRLAALKDDLLNAINLAVVASLKGQKGMFVPNTLKAAMVDSVRKAGVANAGAVVHQVFATHGQEYFANILKMAEKWLGYSAESLAELSDEILGPKDAPEPPELQEENEVDEQLDPVDALPLGASFKNVPIRTVVAAPHSPQQPVEGDGYRQRVASSLYTRMVSSRMGKVK